MIKFKLTNRIRLILIILCGLVFLISGFQFVSKLIAYSMEDRQYEDIRSQTIREQPFAVITPTPLPTTAAHEPAPADETPLPLPYQIISGDAAQLNEGGILKDYEKLKAQNPDLVGWIHIPGYKKPIDYPVMQASDNDYYLNRDFFKNNSYAGSIFMDAINSSWGADRHIVLYGHAMRDMSMFGNLADYPDKEEEYTQIKHIYLDLLNTRLEYEVFSAYYEESTYNYRQMYFSDDAEYLDFLERIRSKSLHNFGVTLSSSDKILTLSTCKSDYGKDGRTIIHARLSRQIVYDGTDNITFSENIVSENDKKVISANTYLESLSLKYSLADILFVEETDGPEVEGIPTASAIEAPEADSSAMPTATPKVAPAELPTAVPSVAPTASPEQTENPKQATDDAADLIEAVLTPKFRSSVKEYEVVVPKGLSKIYIYAATADPKARLNAMVNETPAAEPFILLGGEETIVKMKVTSQDGLFAFTYTIKIRWESFITDDPPVPEA